MVTCGYSARVNFSYRLFIENFKQFKVSAFTFLDVFLFNNFAYRNFTKISVVISQVKIEE
jgi:hypothetical protein